MVDVTDATFETEVLARSEHALVVVDLWAEWCGPCKSLGPILERVVASTNGAAVLAKVDVDANPAVSRMFQVQSIPAVFAVRDRKVVDTFVGAQPEPAVADFVRRNLPADSELEVASLIDFGDEVSLRRALEIKPGHVAATLALAKLLVETDRSDEGLSLLATVPESMESRHIAALARCSKPHADFADERVDPSGRGAGAERCGRHHHRAGHQRSIRPRNLATAHGARGGSRRSVGQVRLVGFPYPVPVELFRLSHPGFPSLGCLPEDPTRMRGRVDRSTAGGDGQT